MTSSEPEISYLRLISRLVALARALAEMRMAQLRAAQAAAALQAAELDSVACSCNAGDDNPH